MQFTDNWNLKNNQNVIHEIGKNILWFSAVARNLFYNDTLLKEVASEGITTISKDFFLIGKQLARMVQNKVKVQIRNPAYLIRRKSL
jgi:hypothetical protein